VQEAEDAKEAFPAAADAAQDATGVSLSDLKGKTALFKQEVEATRIRTLPTTDDRNFDSFIEAEDYNDVNIEVLNLNDIIYHNFNQDIHKYKALASYRIEFSEDFYSIVVTIKKGETKMESILINYTLDGKFIDSILISHDEIDENPTRTTTKITQSTLTRSHIFQEGEEERTEESVYKIDVEGRIVELSSEEVLIEDVKLQLGLENAKLNTRLLTSKRNPANKQETIIVIPEYGTLYDDEMHFNLNTYIVIVNNITGKITHKYFERSKTNGWVSDAIYLSEITIDTAPYIVAIDKRAFGIRVYYYNSSKPNPFSNKTISLFVKSGDTLKNVLHNYEVMNYGGEWDSDCEGEFTEEKKILIISEKSTNGYFNISVKNTIVYSVNHTSEDGDCDTEKEVVIKKTSLKFDGETYTSN
jgi:hypothetical protein